MNRRGSGGEMLAFFMFIFLLGIVGASIAWGVNSYFKGEYDFRYEEARLLNLDVKDCLEKNDFFSEGFDFYSACGINKDIKGLFVLVKSSDREFLIGVRDFETQCQLSAKNFNYPRCFSSELVKGEDYTIITGSNNLKEGVR